MSEPSELETTDYSERDAATLKILGFFFAILGSLVLVGSYWSLENPRALIVNLASGTLLTIIGLGLMAFVRRSKRKRNDR